MQQSRPEAAAAAAAAPDMEITTADLGPGRAAA